MRTYKIPSSNPKAEPYTVLIDGPDGSECNCKAFEYSTTDPAHCKHISAGRKLLQAEFDEILRDTAEHAADSEKEG